MALDTYTNLQAAIINEIDISEAELTTAVPDLIARAEKKINRKLKIHDMEQLSYFNFTVALDDRRWPLPDGMLEMLDVRIKPSGADDTQYTQCKYVAPINMVKYYTSAGRPALFTIRKNGEFERKADQTYEVMMHYTKAWDIANEGTETNWLLTNHPDIYLYGAMAEVEMFERNPEIVVGWKTLFEEAIDDLNKLSEKTKDDAVLDTCEVAGMTSAAALPFNVLTNR